MAPDRMDGKLFDGCAVGPLSAAPIKRMGRFVENQYKEETEMPGTRKLGKTTDQRMAMLRQQVTDFLDNGKMETTVTRCKEIKPLAEKMITLGKKNDLAAYRQAMSFITREDVCKKIFKEIAPSYAERNGGYTRIVRTGVRRGDAAETAIIELVK